MSDREAPFGERIDAAADPLALGAVVVDLLRAHGELDRARGEGFGETAQRLAAANPVLSELMSRAEDRWINLEWQRRGGAGEEKGT
jgi:hypothetical protein